MDFCKIINICDNVTYMMITSKEIDQISLLKEQVQKDPNLLGLYHFGSSLLETTYRDIDLCIIIMGETLSLEKRLKCGISGFQSDPISLPRLGDSQS